MKYIKRFALLLLLTLSALSLTACDSDELARLLREALLKLMQHNQVTEGVR